MFLPIGMVLLSAFAEVPMTEKTDLLRRFPAIKSECGEAKIEINYLQLKRESFGGNATKATVVSCPDHCGEGGCPYLIFEDHQKIVQFFGVYEVLKSRTNNHLDMKVSTSLGADLHSEVTLKFNGKFYE